MKKWLNKYNRAQDGIEDEGERLNREAHAASSKQARIETAKENVKKNYDEISDSFLWNLPGSISPLAAEELILGGIGKGAKFLKGTKLGKTLSKKTMDYINPVINKLSKSTSKITDADTPRWMVDLQRAEGIEKMEDAAEMVRKDLADPETIRRATKLGVDPDKLKMASKNLDINVTESYGSSLAGNEMRLNPKNINDPSIGTISGNEVASHETGHLFQDQDLWNVDFPRNLPSMNAKMFHQSKQSDPATYEKLLDYYQNYSTRPSAPTKVDELLGALSSRNPQTFPETGENALAYFRNAGDSYGTKTDNMIERLPMFREYRQGMRDSGILKNKWDEITPEHMNAYYKLNPNNRLNSFMAGTPDNTKLINKISKIAPAVGTGTVLANQGEGSYQDGGESLKETAPTKWLDSIHGANMDKEWVRDLFLRNGPNIQVDGYEGTSTHLMSQYDNTAAPQIARKNGKLEYDPLYELKQGHGIDFKNEKDALDYTKMYKKGTGVLQQNGGVIDGQRGQWDNPGKITRIKGGNITMGPDPKTGAPLTQTLMGISDKGERQIMYPGEDYSFKNAKYVTEYPMAQDGKVNPHYVNSKSDPRYIAYQDSLDLYNNYIDVTKALKEQEYPKYKSDSLNVAKDKTPLSDSWIGNSRSAVALRDPKRMNKRWEKEKYEATNKEGLSKRVSPTLMETPDFITGVINRTLPNQLYSDTIDPISLDQYVYPLEEEFQNTLWGKLFGSGLKNEEAVQEYNKRTGDYRPGDARVVANYSNVNPRQEVIVEDGTPTTTANPRNKTKAITGKSSGLQQIDYKNDADILKKYPKAKIPKRYNTLQIHSQNTMENRSNTPEETERLFDEYDRFKDIKGGPRLKVTPNYQNGIMAQDGIEEDEPYEPLTTGTNWLDEVVVTGKTTPMARMISKYTPESETSEDAPAGSFKEYKPIAQDTHANTDSFVKQKTLLKPQIIDSTQKKKSPEENALAWEKLEEDMRVRHTDYVAPIITKDFVESSNKYARDAEIASTRSFEDFYIKTPEEVKELQTELKEKGYSLGPTGVDSKYGPYTNKAYTSMLEDDRLDDSTISKYYKKYSPTTSNNVKEIQRKLIDEGFLSEKSKYGRDNIDGKFGNLTRDALMDYNSSKNEEDLKGLVFDIIPQTIEEPRCAAGMCNILEMNNIETQAVGIKYKDAWDLHENMIEADNSEQIFNIYDDPAFANINESTPIEELKRITREVKRKKQTKASHYKVGDIVGIYWPESKYHAKTLKSKTYNTHSGFVSSIENGVPIITHNLNGNIKNQPFNEVNTAWISRPNDNVVINSTYNEQLDSDALSSTAINPSLLRNLEQKKERPLTAKEKTIASNIMQRSKYNSTHIPEILNSTVDSNWLDAATFAITGVETGGGVSAPRTREDVGGLRGLAHDIKGTKEGDISLGVGKVKFDLLDSFAKTYFDIKSPKDLADDNKSVDVISYLLTKNYELFKDYAIQYPELGLKEEDLRNMSILSHNQGNSRLLRTGRSKTNPMTKEEELKALRELYEGTVADISSTNYSKVPVVGRAAYKAALAVGKEKPGERYISKVNRYIEEVYNIPDKRMAISTEESGGWLDNIN